MPIPTQIKSFLESMHVQYTTHAHTPAYTAQTLAHAEHVSGKQLAKVVMVLADERLVMCVLPGSHYVDLNQLNELLDAQKLRLAAENEFKDVFPDCELGAMPPFGNLYHLEVWVDPALASQPHIYFNAGTHRETIQIDFTDFERVVVPKIGKFAEVRH
jgi:Ala-tRNA(Pro) deacylase